MKTREKIMQEALNLFSVNGVEKTSTAKISSAAGLSSGALFTHFPTKQNLVEEIYLEKKISAMKKFTAEFSLDTGTAYCVKSITEKMLIHYGNNPKDFKFIRMVQMSPSMSPRITEYIKIQYEAQTEILNIWIKNGSLKNFDSYLLGQLWWALVIPFIEKMHNENVTKPKLEWIDFVWDSLRK